MTRPVKDLKLERIVGLAYKIDRSLPLELINAIELAKEQMKLIV